MLKEASQCGVRWLKVRVGPRTWISAHETTDAQPHIVSLDLGQLQGEFPHARAMCRARAEALIFKGAGRVRICRLWDGCHGQDRAGRRGQG